MADGVLQYIGARYVPQFYLNSDGTSEWKPGVAFEPLTIVTWNNNSFTSRKPVPAEIGEPSVNPEYWAQTGVYNAQIGQLQNDVAELQTTVSEMDDTVKAAIKWYTPEMFGAVGDGTTDDTEAFKDMFETIPDKASILCLGTYVIKDQITIAQNDIKLSGGFARSEYTPALIFMRTQPQTPDIYVTGYGAGFSNILFRAIGQSNNDTLIEFDASGNSGNIDAIFTGCGFFNAWRAIHARGRNVLVSHSIFSMVTVGYDVTELTGIATEYRGFIVQNCRVHQCNTLLRSVVAIAPDVAKGIAIMNNYIDYTATAINAVSGGIEVIGNIFKRYNITGGPSLVIQKNPLDSDYSYINVINGNVFEGNSQSRGVETNEAPVIVTNNTFNTFNGHAVGCITAGKVIAKNNTFSGITGACVSCAAAVTGVVKYNTAIGGGNFAAPGATVADNDTVS